MLISLVLVVLVGNTVRTLQGVGWLSITPIDVEFPLWMGTWLGVFPTVESLVAQGGAFAFVIGSYYAAEWVRKRHVRHAAAASRDRIASIDPEPEQVVTQNGNGNGVPAGYAGNGIGRNGDRAGDGDDAPAERSFRS